MKTYKTDFEQQIIARLDAAMHYIDNCRGENMANAWQNMAREIVRLYDEACEFDGHCEFHSQIVMYEARKRLEQ